MIQGYRILILGDEGAPLRELRISRSAVRLVVAAAISSGCLLLAFAGAALGARLFSMPAHKPPSHLPLPLAYIPKKLLAATPIPQSARPNEPCGANMILVEGNYCPAVFHRCQRYTDPRGSALHGQRCAEYKQPATCLSPQRQHLRYCIDRDEYLVEGDPLPNSRHTFEDARKLCEKQGKRLCSNAEWTFACEGEMMNPYPYGYVRDSEACNADRSEIVNKDGELLDLRAAPGSFPRCQSPFGVRDLSGNLEEYALEDNTRLPIRKGGYWQSGPNHCRFTEAHPETNYRSIEVGFRCCADSGGKPVAADSARAR